MPKRCTQFVLGIAVCVAMLTAVRLTGQAPPKDLYPDGDMGVIQYRENSGQLRDTDGDPRPGVKFYSEKSRLGIYLSEKSLASFAWADIDQDTSTVDTLFRVDMSFEDGEERSPISYAATTGRANYYRADGTYEEVNAFHRVIYRDVWDSVDVHFHHGQLSPRITFAIKPTGDPDDISLKFTGQDSLLEDFDGRLWIYLEEKWIVFEEAVAYQLDGSGDPVPVNWTASYELEEGSAYVKFEVDSYDPEEPLFIEIGYPPLEGGTGEPQDNVDWSTTAGRDGYWGNPGDFILGATGLPDKDVVVVGNTADAEFPVNPGLVQVDIQLRDVFVSRFNYAPGDPDEDARAIWTTFWIGNEWDDPTAIYYSSDNNILHIAGWTRSTEIPMRPLINPNDGSYWQDEPNGQSEGYFFCLNQSGTLIRSSFYGGDGADMLSTITGDAYGGIFYFGVTETETGDYADCNATTGGIPLCDGGTSNYQQDDNAGGLDMFVARFDADFHLRWGSFIGTAGDDKVFDSDYVIGASNELDRVAICGQTKGTLPYGTSGSFQLNGNGQQNGFIFTFSSDGAARWGTNLHGIRELQAVSFAKNNVRVMGLTSAGYDSSDVGLSCLAAPGTISLCNPGAGAYCDTSTESIDDYLAEFNWVEGSLRWSTFFGGTTDEEAEAAMDRFNGMHYMPIEVNRFMDLRTDDYDNILAMGLSAQLGSTLPAEFETVAGWGGMYNKPFDPGMGDSQTEITLAMFTTTKELLWLSMFGGQFPHIEIGEPGAVDWDLMHLGCDFGRDLVYFPDQVLYVAGCSGGLDMVRACPYPYPGPSYCESENPLFAGSTDRMDGFVTRFAMENVGVHIAEEHRIGDAELLLYPSPAQDILYIGLPANQPINGTVVEIHNALGQLIRTVQMSSGNSVPVHDLSPGLYSLRITDRRSGSKLQGRFQIQ